MSNSKVNKTTAQIFYEREYWGDFKSYEEEYSLAKKQVKKQLEALEEIQRERTTLSHGYGLTLFDIPMSKFFGYGLIIAIIALYDSGQVLFSGILVLLFLKYLESSIAEESKTMRENFSLIQRRMNQKSEQSSELINGIKGSLDYLFKAQQNKDTMLKQKTTAHVSDIDLNGRRIKSLEDSISPEAYSDALNKPSNDDIDEKMIEYKNWDLDTTFLLLKKISNEEFETPVPEIVLKRIVHMCDRTDKNELDEDDVKNIKDFTGSKDVINRILKALNIELFVRSIDEELEEVANTIPHEHGAAQFIWLAQKQYLKEKYNIDWLSQQDLRPDVDFS
jgi:hypothetical protein